MDKHITIVGSLLALCSALAYAILGIIVKTEASQVNTIFIIAIQSFVTIILILPILQQQKSWGVIKKSPHKLIHFIRTLFSLGISFFLFLAIKAMPLVNALTVFNTAPLMVPIIAFYLMHQPFNHKLWLPMLAGLIGVIIILHPNPHQFDWHSTFALAAGFCMAMSMVLVKKTTAQDNSLTVMFYYFLYSTVISAIAIIFYWQHLAWHTWLWLIVIGFLFFITQHTISVAIKMIAPELTATLYYSNIIFAAILGIFITHHIPNLTTIFGIIITCAAGMTCIYFSKRKVVTP